MKEVYEFPPNIEAIRAVLDVPEYGVVFTYGDILYNPDKGYIDQPLWTHEQTHRDQQLRMGVEAWWEQYLLDPVFRTSQEIEAYHNQYQHFCRLHADRNRRIVFLMHIARDLSSPMYGAVISQQEAINKIKDGIVQKSWTVQFSEKGSTLEERTER